MYICLCKGITEEMVEKALRKSPHAKEALKSLGVGSDCGICVIEAVERIQQKLAAAHKNNSIKTNQK